MSRNSKGNSRRSSSCSRIPKLSLTDQSYRPTLFGHYGRSNSNLGNSAPRRSSSVPRRPSSTLLAPNWTAKDAKKTTPNTSRNSVSHLTLSDSKWRSTSFEMVRKFIHERNADIQPLHPPTVKSFIEVMNLLFNEIDPRAETSKITKENYIVKIISELKIYRYPGVITPSLLKTVNTNHSWPQILAIWTWLVNCINLLKYPELETLQTVDGEYNYTYSKIQSATIQSNITSFILWDQEQDNEENNLEYEKELCNIRGFSCSKLTNLEMENMNLKEQLEKQQCKESDVLEKINHYKNQINTYVHEMNIYSKNAKTSENLMNELELTLNRKNENLDLQLEKKKLNIKLLEDQADKQVGSIQEKKKLEDTIDILTHGKKLKLARKQDTLQHIESLDNQLVSNKKELDSIIYYKNKQIKRFALIKPELGELTLQPSIMLHIENDEVLKNIVNKLKNILAEEMIIKSEYDKKIAMINQNESTLHQEMTLTQKEIANHITNIENLNKEPEEIKMKHKFEMNKIEEQIRHKETIISEVQDNFPNLNSKEEEYQMLLEKRAQRKKELKEIGIQSKKEILELHTVMAKEISQCREIFFGLIDAYKKYSDEEESVIGYVTTLLDSIESITESKDLM